MRALVRCAPLALCCACASQPETFSADAVDSAVAEHEQPAQPPPSNVTSECRIDAEIAAAVRLRGLPVLAPIRCQILDRKAMVERALTTALRETPKPWLEGQVLWLVLLGLAADDFQMVPAISSLLDEQLAGFYDPQEDVLFVTADTADRMTLVHEVVHALQDQHFDLGRRMREAKTSDALSALQILAEGDATSAMLEIPRDGGQSQVAAAAVFNNVGAFFAEATPTEVPVPPILKRGLIAPYLDGFSLVEGLRAAGDWAAVNALWAQTPRVSAQLLSEQPLKFPAHQAAQELPESPPWRATLKPLYDDVTGEQSMRVLFEEWLARNKAAEAARGWVADRVTVWSEQGASALFWRLRWANETDTQQALRAFAKGYFPEQVATLMPSARTPRILTRGCDGSTGHPLALATRGSDIVLTAQSRNAGTGREVCERLAKWAQSALQ
ncbi:MAG TPA: hypothetical protein VHO25_20245 [Polyangiaceae bacterium]|nr:hypothetical protein [Polyangiaceae bacterium]